MTRVDEGLVRTIRARDWDAPPHFDGNPVVGGARLIRHSLAPGYYRMEGTDGYELYQIVGGRLNTVELQRRDGKRWKTWMTNDPLHWFAMGEIVRELPPGRILCAGLGLGLMAHHLVAREDVSLIVIVELDPDVVELVGPTLPPDSRREIIVGDYYAHLADGLGTQFDAILWDLAVGERDETLADFARAAATAWAYAPETPLYRFGERRHPR